MISNCSQCKYFDHHPNDKRDIRCAVFPDYALMWTTLEYFAESTLQAIPIDFCSDFALDPRLEEKEIPFSLTFGEWRKFLTSSHGEKSSDRNQNLLNSISKITVEHSLSLSLGEWSNLLFYAHKAEDLPPSLRNLVIDQSPSLTIQDWQAIANSSKIPQVLETLAEHGIKPEEEERWINVDSSCISAIAFNRSSSKLSVRFVSGVVYEYFDVFPGTFQDFLDAGSKGGFFNFHIKEQYSHIYIGFA